MAPLFGPTGSALPIRIKAYTDILPTSVTQNDSELRASLVNGTTYWFEIIHRGQSPSTGATQSARMTFSGTINYGIMWRLSKPTPKTEEDTTFDTGSGSAVWEDGGTMTSVNSWTTGTALTSVFAGFTTTYMTGLILPSSDGLLEFSIGINSTSAGGTCNYRSTMRVQEV